MSAEWDDLARLAERATPGEWTTYAAYGSRGVEVADTEDMLFIQDGGVTYAVNEADAEFIAAANPATILRLIEALRLRDLRVAALEEQNEDLTAERDELAQAMWDAYTVLGFDTDGDKTPGARIAGAKSYEAFAAWFIARAAEARSDHDEAVEEAWQHMQRVSELSARLSETETNLQGWMDEARALAARLAAVEAVLDGADEDSGPSPLARILRAALAAPTDTTKEN